MLNLSFIRNHIDLIKQKIEQRHISVPLHKLEQYDRQWRNLLQETEQLRHKKNKNNNEIILLRNQKKDTVTKIDEMKEISEQIKQLDKELRSCEEKLKALQLTIPNIPHDTVPIGVNASDNKEISIYGEKPQFSFKPKPHWDLGLKLGILDFDRATKITGARFSLYAGMGAKLERALINFMLDIHTQINGYIEISPPLMATDNTMFGTGQLPKFESDQFEIKLNDDKSKKFLIPTAEVILTNLVRDSFVVEKDLPLRFVASTACFRKEAGSYGKDTKGMIRQHQFYKVELVSIVHPNNSFSELERMTNCAQEILKRLKLPYRLVLLSTGDMGFSAEKTFDLEVWIPSENKYREISSCSSCGQFQARRMKAKFKTNKNETDFLSTLNGSGLAVGRTLISIMENYQQKDGSIIIPDALRPYMHNQKRIG